MKEAPQKDGQSRFGSLSTSLLLLLVALVCVTAATTAWFTIADRTRVHNFAMNVSAGPSIRFDLNPHDSIEDYVQTLRFGDIADRILKDQGYDPRVTPLEPVTTKDYVNYMLEDETLVAPSGGQYLEFTLHFIANQDLVVHLSSADTQGQFDGTEVSSDVRELPQAMRISFSDGTWTYVYSPGQKAGSYMDGNAKIFGLPDGSRMVYNNDNAMFSLRENVNKPIVVRIWLEGTDEACTDAVQAAEYQIQLRFEATDENNNVLSTAGQHAGNSSKN